MFRTSYSHLNTIQKGHFGEAVAKMAFTLEGYEVYTTEFDDRGIDFVIRSPEGNFYSVQVKTTGQSANPCIYARKFEASDRFLFFHVRLKEGEPPVLYTALGHEWGGALECLSHNEGGGHSGAYYEIRFADKYAGELETLRFENYVERLK
jgi:hypothetical protein